MNENVGITTAQIAVITQKTMGEVNETSAQMFPEIDMAKPFVRFDIHDAYDIMLELTGEERKILTEPPSGTRLTAKGFCIKHGIETDRFILGREAAYLANGENIYKETTKAKTGAMIAMWPERIWLSAFEKMRDEEITE